MERHTRQRDIIMRTIEDAARPLAKQEILTLAQREIPGLGIATVYRTVKILCEEGWLEAVDLPNSQVRYERKGKGHHHHFHCRDCDRVFEIDGCPGNLRNLAPRGFQTESHEIVISGLCAGCAKKG